MNGPMLLQQAAGVIEHRERIRANRRELRRRRRALAAGARDTVTPVQVVLCLIDLKLARLSHDPSHLDSIVDVAGYAALLREVRHAR